MLSGRIIWGQRLREHRRKNMIDSAWIPHIIKEGSRTHVVWWDSAGEHCTEPYCEINKPHDDLQQEFDELEKASVDDLLNFERGLE